LLEENGGAQTQVEIKKNAIGVGKTKEIKKKYK